MPTGDSTPDEGPLAGDEPPPAGLAEFRAPLEERPGYKWVEETFRRHRAAASVRVSRASREEPRAQSCC